MTTADIIRIPYQPDLYVPREAAEEKIQKWLAGNGRLLTITSPPATGKSWLLKHTEGQIQADANSHSVWLDVCDFLTPPTGSLIGTHTIDSARQAEWLAGFLAKEKELCKDVPDYDAGVETAVLLERFAAAVQQCHPDQKLYLLVEGGDEPDEPTWRTIERQILEPIARVIQWHFVIVLRQEQRLISYMLRRDEQRFTLAQIFQKGREQLEKLWAAEENPDLPNINTIFSILPGYPWSHPGINHFLFLEIKANYHLPPANWLAQDYRLRGLSAITQFPLERVNGMYTYLQEIVNQLDSNWTPDDLRTHLGISMSATWSLIEKLKAAWLVESVTHNRIKITDGVREFVQ